MEIFRLNAIKHARALCDKLHEREVQLHESMPNHARVVVKSQRILLSEQLLKDTGYEDLQVVDFMKQGVELPRPASLRKVESGSSGQQGGAASERGCVEKESYAIL